jgi:hypothetical protein
VLRRRLAMAVRAAILLVVAEDAMCVCAVLFALGCLITVKTALFPILMTCGA